MDCVELVSNQQSKGVGVLRVEESALFWGPQLRFDYLSIVLHAICRDTEAFPKPCIYLQVQLDRENDDAEVEEIYLVPSEASQVEEIFEAMSRCAELHRDPQSDDEDGGGQIFGQFDDA